MSKDLQCVDHESQKFAALLRENEATIARLTEERDRLRLGYRKIRDELLKAGQWHTGCDCFARFAVIAEAADAALLPAAPKEAT